MTAEKDGCVCPPAANYLCLGIPGETTGCAACLALDPEEPCLRDPLPILPGGGDV